MSNNPNVFDVNPTWTRGTITVTVTRNDTDRTTIRLQGETPDQVDLTRVTISQDCTTITGNGTV